MPTNKAHLLAWLSALLVAGFLAVSLGGYYVSKDSVREGIIAHELPLAGDNIYSEIQKDLLKPIYISSVMAQDTFLRDWVLAGEKDVDQVARYLREIKARYETITSFFISEKSRTYYHAAGILKTVRQEDPRDIWYFRVRLLQQPFEINVDPDQANRDAMTIFINYRVFDYDGNFIGITGVGLTADTVRLLIESYQARFHRRVYFIDPSGRVALRGKGSRLDDSIREAEGIRDIADAILKTGTTSGSFEYEAGGKTILLNTRFIPELGWYLLVEQEVDAALRPLRNALFGNLGVSAGVILIVLLLAGYTVNRFQGRLEEMATMDRLTSLFNRNALDLMFAQTVRDLPRSGQALSLILLDIDRFKSINDRFGHLKGDEVLAAIAGLIRGAIRANDLAGRWGGEEFLVLLKDCNLEQAMGIAEKIRAAVLEADFGLRPATDKEAVTVSLGVTQHRSGEGVDAILARADAALYRAKESGRNRTVSDTGL